MNDLVGFQLGVCVDRTVVKGHCEQYSMSKVLFPGANFPVQIDVMSHGSLCDGLSTFVP